MNIDIPALRELIRVDKRAAGAILSTVRESLPDGGWTRWVRLNDLRYSTISACLLAYDPAKYPKKSRGPATPAIPAGEIHEATRGFKAMMTKAAAEEDIAQSRRRRVVAFQHFKFLLARSNLPALMQMSPDEIIELVRKI